MISVEERERCIDEILAESFPASDPPPWTTGLGPDSEVGACPEEARAAQKAAPPTPRGAKRRLES